MLLFVATKAISYTTTPTCPTYLACQAPAAQENDFSDFSSMDDDAFASELESEESKAMYEETPRPS